MRIAIVQFPGSNCERETSLAVKRAGMEAIEFLWNESHEKLRQMDGYIIVGGFSYEDRSRAGIIAALDPIMQEIKVQSEKGKPVLGICNGAQILVETGLVPGLENHKLAAALAENKRVADNKILGTGYYNAWVYLRLSDEYQRNAFTRHLTPKHILSVPIAHGEGRFIMTDALLAEIEHQGLNVFQYCDANGNIINHFPVNPNGSIGNIAALSNKMGNVMAIMPHPERTLQGDVIFASMRDYIREGRIQQTVPLYYYPRQLQLPSYQKPENAHDYLADLIITDNEALTVQNTLQSMGLPVTVKRSQHWQIEYTDQQEQTTFAAIKKSGVLFNERKETVKPSSAITHSNMISFLVTAKEDLLGQEKKQILADHFAMQNIANIKHGVLWQFQIENANMQEIADEILHTNILFNRYAHDCYQYHPILF